MGDAVTLIRRAVGPYGVAVFVGGSAGALGRAGLGELLPWHGGWPWATFVANLTGTAALALIVVLASGDSRARGLWGSGFCGALTTFSTLQLEAIELARDEQVRLAAAYLSISLGAGLAVALGAGALARRVVAR